MHQPSVVETYTKSLKKKIWLFIVFLCALVALGIFSVALGSFDMSPLKVIAALFGQAEGSAGIVVWNIRMPRIVAAVVAGWGLGVAIHPRPRQAILLPEPPEQDRWGLSTPIPKQRILGAPEDSPIWAAEPEVPGAIRNDGPQDVEGDSVAFGVTPRLKLAVVKPPEPDCFRQNPEAAIFFSQQIFAFVEPGPEVPEGLESVAIQSIEA